MVIFDGESVVMPITFLAYMQIARLDDDFIHTIFVVHIVGNNIAILAFLSVRELFAIDENICWCHFNCDFAVVGFDISISC